MNHLIISREYPPAAYGAGGIGSYVANMARLMAERGETVHVIGERWKGAPLQRETSHGDRLVVHRIGAGDSPRSQLSNLKGGVTPELEGLRKTDFPEQWFAWHAAFLAESLIEHENIEVIEGQEWEAPLYYFLLRRALGAGPKRHPPCIVHLHSTTEFIRHFNGTLSSPRAYIPMKRMEEFCIRAADALLCPSRYFAHQCAAYYALPSDLIKVIQLPLGFMDLAERHPDVWARGTICFVGRLEPRKGIIEWIEAASRVAEEQIGVEFDIVGADTFGMQRTLVSRIPSALRSRFRFHGPKTRAELPGLLAGARAAVVPSRWENFPNVCVEAMSAGLPVISTRLGGMVELVEDGRTGWLTPDTGVAGMVDGLADALRRCLAASPAERASMGRAAAETIRRLCNNQRTVDEQITFRTEVAHSGAKRSKALASGPRNWLGSAAKVTAANADCAGAGIIVRVRVPTDARLTLESIRAQTVQPRVVAIVHSCQPALAENIRDCSTSRENVVLLHCPDRTGADAWNAGFEALQSREKCGFWVFLDEYDDLLPDYVSRIERVFAYRPEVGVIAVWTERTVGRRSLEAPLCPGPEHQLRANEATPASALRAEALGEAPPFRRGMPPGYDINDLANLVMAGGWQAAAYPEILARRRQRQQDVAWPDSTALRAMRAEVLSRFSNVISRQTLALVDEHVQIPLAASDSSDQKSFAERTLHYTMITALHPRRAARALLRRVSTGVMWLGSQFSREKTQTAR